MSFVSWLSKISFFQTFFLHLKININAINAASLNIVIDTPI